MDLLRPLKDAIYAGQNVAYTGTAGSTTGWPAGPQGVLINPTTDAYVSVGEGVTATASDTFVKAGASVAFRVEPGTGAPWRVSAIQVSAGGTIYAKPINIQ